MRIMVNKHLSFGFVVILLGSFTCSLGAEEMPNIAMTMSDCGDAGGKVILKGNEFRDQGIWYCDLEGGRRIQCVGQAKNETNCHLNDEPK